MVIILGLKGCKSYYLYFITFASCLECHSVLLLKEIDQYVVTILLTACICFASQLVLANVHLPAGLFLVIGVVIGTAVFLKVSNDSFFSLILTHPFLYSWCVSVSRENISQPGSDHVYFVLSSDRFVLLLRISTMLELSCSVGDGLV